MAVIDLTYFVGDLYIPNLDQPQVEDEVTQAVDQYERKVLIDLLGYELHKDFAANPMATKWLDFKNGKEFTFKLNGKDVVTKWPGLANAEKDSLIAYFVYYKYMFRNLSHSAGAGGEVEADVENSERVAAARKLSLAWNRMLERYGDLSDVDPYVAYWGALWFCFDKRTLTTYQHFNDKPSAYNFLLANKATYDTWVFEPKRQGNIMGL